jgi:hypothetical protein
MSDALAIATVTATLKDLITQSAQSTVSGATVVVGRPQPPADSERRVYLYLYNIAPNPALRNDDLPTRSGDTIRSRPKAALVLHYLVAFQGNDGDLEPERMLGAVVRDLHARPILSRDDMRSAINARATLLPNANLPEAIERVRLTPLPLTLEDHAKLWSVFFQTPHAMSIAYEASVVVIDALEAARTVLPVLFRGDGDRGPTVIAGAPPAIHSIHIGEPGDPLTGILPNSYPSATLGRRLLIAGERLAGAPVRLRFRHTRLGFAIDAPIAAANVDASRIVFTLPADAAASAAWAAGVFDVTAVVGGTAVEPARLSNRVNLALAPSVAAISPVGNIPRDASGTAVITVSCTPQVRVGQRSVLVLNGHEIAAEPRTAAADPLVFRVLNATPQNNARIYLRVDDVESMPFERTAVPPGLAFNAAHLVTIV